jgi:hypothetical protein
VITAASHSLTVGLAAANVPLTKDTRQLSRSDQGGLPLPAFLLGFRQEIERPEILTRMEVLIKDTHKHGVWTGYMRKECHG